MNAYKALFLSALVVATAACSVQSTDGGTAPEMSTGFLGSKNDDVTIDTPAAFKNANQVVIGAFNVGFLNYKKASAKAGGGLLGSGMGGRSSAKMTLHGVDDATMQQITDAAYKDFVQQLKRNGYTIADREQLLTSADFAKVNKTPSPLKKEASFFGSQTSVTYVAPTELKDVIVFQGEAGETGGFGFSNATLGASLFADKTKIPVIAVSYLIDFANAEGYGGWHRSSSSVQVGQGISIAPGGGIVFLGGQGGTFSTANGSVKLGQPIYSTETYGEMLGTTSDAEKGVETAVNVATAVLGGGTNISRSFDVKADPAKYERITTKVLSEANTKLVDKIAGLK